MSECKYGFKHWDGDDCAICNRDQRIAELEAENKVLREVQQLASEILENVPLPAYYREALTKALQEERK